MDIGKFYDLLQEYTLDNKNYLGWRKIHGDQFGKVFTESFSDSIEAQIHLTAALIKISGRHFEEGLTKLLMLENFCFNDFDSAALSYFIGLCYEFMQNEPKMNAYYEKMSYFGGEFLYNIAFFPYYRTAKFAQRDSECKKAIYYYGKAIDLYGESETDSEKLKILGQLCYDMGTVYAFCHKYDTALNYLKKSYKFNPAENNQRNYVMAIHCALAGKTEEMNRLLDNMPNFLREHCRQLTSAILNKQECHYFVVEQNREGYGEFWKRFSDNEKNLIELVENNEIRKAETIISEYLTETLSFMRKNLYCRIVRNGSDILVKCKSGYTKTLNAEYEALFSLKNESLSRWNFVAVNEFSEEQ